MNSRRKILLVRKRESVREKMSVMISMVSIMIRLVVVEI